MISFIYEGDLNYLKGGMVITGVLKRRILTSYFKCEILLNRKIYPCDISIRKFGGFKVERFDLSSDEKEVMELLEKNFSSNKSFLFHYWLRLISKLVILFFQFYVPVYFILHVAAVDVATSVGCIPILIIGEVVLYLLQGIINRW